MPSICSHALVAPKCLSVVTSRVAQVAPISCSHAPVAPDGNHVCVKVARSAPIIYTHASVAPDLKHEFVSCYVMPLVPYYKAIAYTGVYG